MKIYINTEIEIQMCPYEDYSREIMCRNAHYGHHN